MTRVLVCDPIDADGIQKLKDSGFEVDDKPTISAEELLTLVGQYDALIVRGRTRVTKQVLDAATRLKAVARAGVGLDNIDVEHAQKKGIHVISTPEAATSSVAELAVALMLSVLRQIAYADQNLKEGKWVKSSLRGRELKGRTVGVVGAGGRIGGEVARILRGGFGCHVVGYDVVDFKRRADELGIEVAKRLEDLLAKSDIVTIHVPYLQSTHHLINEERIQIMKEGSVLINTSRGDLIDGKAVLDGLRKGELSGLGLDVYHDEPPKEEWEKELVSLHSTLCTCHIGAQTQECQSAASTMVAEKLIDLLRR